MVAGNPKIYGQLVTVLSPFTRILKDVAPASAVATSLAGMVAAARAGMTPEEAFAAAESGDAPVIVVPAKKQATRIRKADMPDSPF